MKGYKVFNSDWTCRGFQYEVGQVYEIDELPRCCEKGFHFCEKASDCFNYYKFDPINKVAEVEALGDIDTDDGTKSCTNKIRIVREIPWNELLNIVNEGRGNIGLSNTGDSNIGNCNTGDSNKGRCNTGSHNTGEFNTGDSNKGNCNTGSRNIGTNNTGGRNTGCLNTGDYNIGSCNTGSRNIGGSNTGNYNTGYRNTGDYNIGDFNTGDWNKSSFNSGCFNTIEPTIMLFNKPSEWTYRDWFDSDASYLLSQIPRYIVQWVSLNNMTDEEKSANPGYEVTGGYLRRLDRSECGQIWWDELDDNQKGIIRSIPNFDESIFEEITGIQV